MSHNPVTGDSIRTKPGDQEKYSEGWDLVFGKLNQGFKEVFEDKEKEDDRDKRD